MVKMLINLVGMLRLDNAMSHSLFKHFASATFFLVTDAALQHSMAWHTTAQYSLLLIMC